MSTVFITPRGMFVDTDSIAQLKSLGIGLNFYTSERSKDNGASPVLICPRPRTLNFSTTSHESDFKLNSFSEYESKITPRISPWRAGMFLDEKKTVQVTEILSNERSKHILKVYDKTWSKNFQCSLESRYSAIGDRDIIKHRLSAWIELGHHPNVVLAHRTLEVGRSEQLLLTEYLGAQTLRDWIGDYGFLYEDYPQNSSRKLLNVLLQIALGLQFTQEKGFPIQDLCPDHIFIHKEKLLKLGDFKIPPWKKFNPGTSKYSCSGGKPEYWAPEQGLIYESLMNAKAVDQQEFFQTLNFLPQISHKCENYSFGLICLELLIGKRIWYRGDRLAHLQELLKSERNQIKTPFFLKTVKEEIFDLINLCLKERPEERINMNEIVIFILDVYNRCFPSPKEQLWTRFFDEEKQLPDNLNNQGVRMLYTGDREGASSCWGQALEINPNHLNSIFNKGISDLISGKINDLRLIQALSRCQESRLRNYFLFLVYFRTGRILHTQDHFSLRESLYDENKSKKISDIKEYHSAVYQKNLKSYEKQSLFITVLKENSLYCLVGRIFAEVRQQKGASLLRVWMMEKGNIFNNALEYKLENELPNTSNTYCPEILTVNKGETLTAFVTGDIINVLTIEKSEKRIGILNHIKGFSGKVSTLAFENKFETLAVATTDSSIIVYNLRPIGIAFNQKIQGLGGQINRMEYFNPSKEGEGSILAVVGADIVKLIELKKAINAQNFSCSSLGKVLSAYNIEEDESIVGVGTSGFCVWDRNSAGTKYYIKDEEISIEAICKSKRLLLLGTNKNLIKVWDFRSPALIRTFEFLGQIQLMSSSKDENSLYFLTDHDYILRERHIEIDQSCILVQEFCSAKETVTLDDEFELQITADYNEALKSLITLFKDYMYEKSEISLLELLSKAEKIKESVDIIQRQEIIVLFNELNKLLYGLGFTSDSFVNSYSERKAVVSSGERSTMVSALNKDRTLLAYTKDFFKIEILRLVERFEVIYFSEEKGFSTGSEINCIKFSLEHKCLIININCKKEKSNTIKIYDLIRKICLFTHKVAFNASDFLYEAHKLLVFGDSGEIWAFDVLNQKFLKKTLIRPGEKSLIAEAITIKEDEEENQEQRIKFVTGGSEGCIRIWEYLDTFSRVQVINSHTEIVKGLCCKTDSREIYSASFDGTIRVLEADGRDYRLTGIYKLPPESQVLHFDMIDQDHFVLLTLENSRIIIYDLKEGKIRWQFRALHEVKKAQWLDYPSLIGVWTYLDFRIYNLFWKYC